MSRLEVMSGEVYGRLTIESELPVRRRKRGTERWFRCVCECGKSTEVPLRRLRSGKTKSCGCLSPKVPKPFVGMKYGRMTVLRATGKVVTPSGVVCRIVECRCDCGNVKSCRLQSLRSGNTKSCGCLAKESSSELGKAFGGSTRTHGRSKSVEYSTWNGMRDRCTNPRDVSWKHYGGRGIKVCDRWLKSFEAFFEDMGVRPSDKHSIHRVDNDGDYEPSNCVWATRKEQSRNTRRTLYADYNGERVNVTDLAERLAETSDVPFSVIVSRLRSGHSAEEAVKAASYNFVQFNGEEVEFNELAFRFGTNPNDVRKKLGKGMSLEEALIRNGDDPFYQLARDMEWYREYERRVAVARVSDLALIHELDEEVLWRAYMSSTEKTLAGKCEDAIKVASSFVSNRSF